MIGLLDIARHSHYLYTATIAALSLTGIVTAAGSSSSSSSSSSSCSLFSIVVAVDNNNTDRPWRSEATARDCKDDDGEAGNKDLESTAQAENTCINSVHAQSLVAFSYLATWSDSVRVELSSCDKAW